VSSDTHGVLANGPHLLVSLADHPCGNGIVDGGEACDDGNRFPSDCCGSTCAYEPATTACARDGDVCTFDRCNATGVCEHVLEPQLSCRPAVGPGKSTLRMSAAADPTKRRLDWKSNGAARELWDLNGFTFFVQGPPIVPDMAMCVYDSAGLVMRATPHGSVLCGSQQCWTSGKAIRYADRAATADGLERIDIQRTRDGEGKTQVKGRGAGLPLPTLPVVNLPLTVQLGTTDGGCWTATYSSPQKNIGAQFKAKSD
jgi:cysteine-rich repeat protein